MYNTIFSHAPKFMNDSDGHTAGQEYIVPDMFYVVNSNGQLAIQESKPGQPKPANRLTVRFLLRGFTGTGDHKMVNFTHMAGDKKVHTTTTMRRFNQLVAAGKLVQVYS